MSKELEALDRLGAVADTSKYWNSDYFVQDINIVEQALIKAQTNEEILQKYYQEGITLDSVRALKKERDNYKKST